MQTIEVVQFYRGCVCYCVHGQFSEKGIEMIRECCEAPPLREELLKMKRDDPKLVALVKEAMQHPRCKSDIDGFAVRKIKFEAGMSPRFRIDRTHRGYEQLITFGKVLED